MEITKRSETERRRDVTETRRDETNTGGTERRRNGTQKERTENRRDPKLKKNLIGTIRTESENHRKRNRDGIITNKKEP